MYSTVNDLHTTAERSYLCEKMKLKQSWSGRIGFVEVKAPGETPRSLQRLRIRTLRRLGFKAFVLDNPEQIGGIIDAIQTP